MSIAPRALARLSNAALYPSKSSLTAAFEIAKKAKIPQMPDVVMALKQEVSSAEPDLSRAANLIAQDLAITGHLLKTINSSAFNLGTKVASVQQAASLMGLKRLSNLVSAEAIDQMLAEQQGTARIIWESIMEEAQLIARVSQVVPGISDDEAYLFGIMHDVGCLIFASISRDYGSAWSLNSHSEPSELIAYEKRNLGVEHHILGFLLARHWQLPDHVAVAICHHHTPGHLNAEDPRVAQLIAISKLAHYLIAISQGTDGLPQMHAYREEAWQDLDISEQDWTDLCDKAAAGELTN
ncbi:HDOD domain-containing protein [Thiorhodococcus mannitoliphagus]|uniref:HDOD domain-containing protein n=1 Tax=Thiorhodococcus mannitoliphagus TaxID=329406 RepID=A0A6P1E0M7_9GAMM|nr:HDOD domain-containing protein [Thiorhodococcus mannitoliphagus]NEX22851.1 HDOD domain-containing protein [Thiorhodococcus mannitoliphagus]